MLAALSRRRTARQRLTSGLALKAFIYGLLTLGAIVSLFPLYWMFNTAFTPGSEVIKLPPELIPKNPSLENFSLVVKAAPNIWRWGANTLFIALVTMGLHVLFDAMSGYAFAKRRFPGSRILFWLVIAALMIPGQVTLVPLYIMISDMRQVLTEITAGWPQHAMVMEAASNYGAVILPGLADVIGIFLMKQFIQTLPSELEEAARIDGASELGIFTRIILPLSAPALAVNAIFAFQRYWNAFLWPLVVLQKQEYYTLQVGLSFVYRSEFGTNYGLLMAGAAMAAIPMIIFFFAFQRYFMAGIRIGALKG
ncbi:MAG: carbohydrate ABC transporter permease [Chloroflexota bacterium]